MGECTNFFFMSTAVAEMTASGFFLTVVRLLKIVVFRVLQCEYLICGWFVYNG